MIQFHDSLDVNQVVQNNFISTILNVVHPTDPFQLVFSFELFCDIFLLCQLRNKPLLHLIGLPVYFFQVRIQCAFHKHFYCVF